MADEESIHNLTAPRNLLQTALHNSQAITSALDKTAPRLERINQRLPSLEASSAHAFVAFVDHIDHAISLAAAVLKVFTSVSELYKSLLSQPYSDLLPYLSLVKQLEEALKLLADSCSLAIQWLEDIVQFIQDRSIADDWYILNVYKCLRILEALQAISGQARVNGGFLDSAFDKLEVEFKQLLTDGGICPSVTSLSCYTSEQACNSLVLPVTILQKLQLIIERLNANNKLNNCISLFVQVRSLNARKCLDAFDLDYLEKSIIEFDNIQDTDDYLDKWSRCFEIAIKHVFRLEHRLCEEVFKKAESDVWLGCFAKIASQSGIVSLLQFGTNFTKGKKDIAKLLKLLDIFAVLDKLREDFNHLFGSKICAEIQSMTRDLIKRVVNGASDIFWEIPVQVELQRKSSPPVDGRVPRLVSYVTYYCNQLLGCKYRPVLTQILEIHQGWKQEKYQGELLNSQVYYTLKEIALNLDSWSKAYHNIALSYLFMTNNHSHFYNLRVTQLGKMMGDSWITAHKKYRDYYAALYLSESWGKLAAFLNQQETEAADVASARARNIDESVKRRLKAFNDAFDKMYEQQSSWVISDEILRLNMCQLVVKTLVPAYRTYLQDCAVLLEEDAGNGKYLRYTDKHIMTMLCSLFQPKLMKQRSTKSTHFVGKIKGLVTNHFHLTLAAP